MGIFSRFFKGGQDGEPADASAGDAVDASAAGDAARGPGAPPAVPPASPDDPAPGVGVTFRSPGIAPSPGLTPAFATPTNAAPSAPEPGRSLWEWTGPQPRRTERGVAPPSATSSDVPAAAPEPRTQARGGLPSVPRSQPESAKETAKERDATMVLSPPPAPAPPNRGGRAATAQPALQIG